MKKKSFLVAASLLFLVAQVTVAEDEIRSTLDDQQEVAVTIYNEQLALVKDLREVTLDDGFNRLAFREVSAQMRPETALLRSINHPEGFHLIEQKL